MALALLAASGVVALLLTPGAQAEPRLLYPNLKTLKPGDLRFDRETIDGTTHQVLRFSNTAYNTGQGPLEMLGKTITTSTGEEKTRVYQRIYSATGIRETTNAVGTFAYHPAHDHFHFGDFAEYQLWTRAEYDAWLRSGRTEGSPRRADLLSSKVTFCIMDYKRVRLKPGSPRYAVYDQCGRHLQGLSVGWGDTYKYYLPDQWVDLGTTSLASGRYVLRSVADPLNRIYESENKEDSARESRKVNAAVTYFTVERNTITVTG
jgi:hypothetical protein